QQILYQVGKAEISRPGQMTDRQVRRDEAVEVEQQEQQRERDQRQVVAPSQEQQTDEADRIVDERIQQRELGRAHAVGKHDQRVPGRVGVADESFGVGNPIGGEERDLACVDGV